MILLDEVVQILGLAQLDGHAAVADQAVHGRSVGAALIDRYRLGNVVPIGRARCSPSTVATQGS